MMAQCASFTVIVAALLINTLSHCSAEVYCVTPTATSCSSCPHNSTHCATLSEYAQEAEMYFTSNTTMVFLPGDHILDRNITVANVARLIMRGRSSSGNKATVVRRCSVGFSFTNMVDLNIHSLAFTSYNRPWSYGSHPACNSALLLRSTQNAELVNCSFRDNLGTALTVHNTNVTLIDNQFIHNQCGCVPDSDNCKVGCGITALNSNLTFIGNTTFRENNASYGGTGAIWASATLLDFDGTSNFINNSANSGGFRNGGAIYAETNSSLRFNGINTFSYNSAKEYGGAIQLLTEPYSSLCFLGISTFSSNRAGYHGGAINAYDNGALIFNGTNNFINNTAEIGGAINAYDNGVLNFIGTNNFINNSANGGGAINAYDNGVLNFIGTNNFINNSANSDGGAISKDKGEIIFTGTNSFISNSARQGGAISATFGSTLTFDGNISFTNNTGNSRGGALYLYLRSTFSILPHTTVHWENNHADLGGAICVYDDNPSIYCSLTNTEREKCFFQLPGQNPNGLDVQLVFKNNSADDAGSVLYGGAIDNCQLNGVNTNSSGEVFDKLIINNDPDHSTTSNISSDPIKICLCKDNLPDCSRSLHYYTLPNLVYPGETFHISVVAFGQRQGTVSSTVRGTAKDTYSYIIDSNPVNLLDYQYLQHTNNTCTKLNFTVFLQSQRVTIELYPEGSPCSEYDRLHISVNLNQTCPPGFNISESARSCVCEQRLANYTKQCYITDGLGHITRESDETSWIGYNYTSHELILHPRCPFDYCVNDTVVFPLNNTDLQCAYNRSGLLCGHCKEGYSLVLGSHQCKKCTNSHLALLIPFALKGVALVFLLLVCKLTVATGTLSGLVFYANIVGVNRTIFLPVESTDAFSVFIAWLNLDFGIETCFYNGLDAYGKTWLQFVFPVYIWLLVALTILISHYSQRFAKLLGNNPVSVLATLILLSYTKILRTLIVAVYITYLEYPGNYNRKVWLYDANIDYLIGKHIPLFLVSVAVFLFLFFPYTLLLLFGQWLQAISHLRLFSWVNNARLKPFMDAYHAPYKAKHRYWPGLLLVLRFVLLLVFAFNHQRNFSINLLAIVVGAGILQLWAWVSGGVYKNWCLDALEGSFILNLIILGAATYHVKVSEGNQLAVGYTSVSITLGTLIVILFYHIFQQLRHTKLWKKVPKLNLEFNKLNTKQVENDLNNPINDPAESVNLDQLREPWLEDLLQPTHSSL